jgi:hypothetical protein
MATHSGNDSPQIFHGGMKGLVIGAIIGTLIPLVFLTIDLVRNQDGGSTSFAWFFGTAFGGGIGFFVGALASRRSGRPLAHTHDGPDRRNSIAGYRGIDRRAR